MNRIFRKTLAVYALAGIWMTFPAISSACERCFGAGSDSPIVSAIGISMLGLLVMIGFVFGGIVSFFNQANNRAKAIENEALNGSSSPQD